MLWVNTKEWESTKIKNEDLYNNYLHTQEKLEKEKDLDCKVSVYPDPKKSLYLVVKSKSTRKTSKVYRTKLWNNGFTKTMIPVVMEKELLIRYMIEH